MLESVEEAVKSGNYDRIKVSALGKAYASASTIVREADSLRNMSESAGVDWTFRGERARGLFGDTILKTIGTTAGQALTKQASQHKQRTDKKRSTEISNIQKLFARQEFDQAEKACFELVQDTDTFFLWLSDQEQQSVTGQLRMVFDELSRVHAQLRPARRRQLGMDAIKKLDLRLNDLISSAEAASLEIRADGETNIDGATYTGSRAFSHLAQQWLDARRKLLNAYGYSVLLSGNWDSELNSLIGVDSNLANWHQVDAEVTKRMQSSLIKIIEADAMKISTANLPKTYREYLQAISGLAIELDDAKFVADCESALMTLTKKDVTFAARVDNYHKATADLLEWHRRVAAARAASQKQTHLAILNQVDTQSLFPQLRAPIPEALASFQSKVGSATHFSKISTKEGRSFSAIDNRVWCSLTEDVAIQGVDSLEKCLFVTADHPPLSLAAAVAIDSASIAHFESVGGLVTGLVPHGRAVRFANLKSDATCFCPPRKFANEEQLIEQVTVKVQLKPQWLQHKYFFVDLSK
jgi:hypothetical protein